jgi:DnaJ-class molecular chaperone
MNGTRKRNHYELLGVARDATVDQIKEAYRDIARLYHPDSNFYDEIIDAPLSADAMGVFKEITAAYNVLVNDEKRREYDQNLPPELADWDSGDSEDFATQLTERERKARETADKVRPDLVGAGKVIRPEAVKTTGFGARFEDDDDTSDTPTSGPLGFVASLIRETLGGNPTLGQTVIVVVGLTLFGVGIVFMLLYLLKR